MIDASNASETHTHVLDVGDADYTVAVHGRAGNADGSDVLIAIHDSRDATAIIRQLPRMPDLLKDPQLMSDMLTDDAAITTATAADGVVKPGDVIRHARPGASFSDEYGNVFVLGYHTDSSDRYTPCLKLDSIDAQFAATVFVDFVRASAKALVETNARVAAHGTHLRNARSELAKLDRETRVRESAARDLVDSLNVSRAYHHATANLRAHQVDVLRRVLVQYASPEAWTGETEGVKNKLTSNIDGFSLAQNALANVTMDDIA